MLEDFRNSFLSFIKRYKNFIILGHLDPDADCIFSQWVMGSYLKRNAKTVCLVNVGPFNCKEIQEFKDYFYDCPPSEYLKAGQEAQTAVIVLDCSSFNRIGLDTSYWQKLKGFEICVIDHHLTGEKFSHYEVVDFSCPSTTLLVYQIGKWLGLQPSKKEAEQLFIGFATDTGFFKYLGEGCAPWVALLSELLSYGVCPKDIYRQLNCKENFSFLPHLQTMLGRVQSYAANRILTFYEIKEMNAKKNPDCDSHYVYQTLLMIESTEVVVFIKENWEKEIFSVGLRSKDKLDVASFAKHHYGGGGHKNAAGFRLPLTTQTREELEVEVVARLEKELEDLTL